MENPLDVMMVPMGPLIIMLQALAPTAMPSYFPKFGGLLHEDLLTQIKRYIKVMVAIVIVKDTYKLVWFFTTLESATYDAETIDDWQTLQTIFF